MTRLAATLRSDIRVQLRNGFYFATAFVAACSIVLLRWLPPELAAVLLPVVLLGNIVMNTFYFVGGLLLLERVEGTFAAQSVTPLRPVEYLASKVLTLTALSLVESLLIATAVVGFDAQLMPSVLYTSLLSLPMLGYLGLGSREFYLAHPIQGPLELMKGPAPYTVGGLAYAIGYPLLCVVPLAYWSRIALRRLRSR
jgi:fluoroquinolone transport system permease protein